jgi:phosphate acetyltransferase
MNKEGMETMSNFLQGLKKSIENHKGRVAFPESTDLRILQAINHLFQERVLAKAFVFSPRVELLSLAKKNKLQALLDEKDRLVCVGEDLILPREEMESFLREQMKQKPLSESGLQEHAASPLYQAGYLLHEGQVDCVLAGVRTETSHVIRAALRTVGKADGVQTISGAFLMERKDEVYLYADCAVMIEPTLEELVDIATESKKTWESLAPLAQKDVRMAFLSFSTKGSAKHRSCMKMERAAQMTQERHPGLLVDGELQFDAAYDEVISQRKAPNSPIAGQANVFIFPDLNAGNIAYKITQRLGGFAAYGPILQGLKKPYCDLSRGATVHDIVACVYINLLRARQS